MCVQYKQLAVRHVITPESSVEIYSQIIYYAAPRIRSLNCGGGAGSMNGAHHSLTDALCLAIRKIVSTRLQQDWHLHCNFFFVHANVTA